MDTIVAISPIAILIWLMTKKKSMPSHLALPFVAVLLYLLKILYFGSDLKLMNATVINGLLTAWTPILVIWGGHFSLPHHGKHGCHEHHSEVAQQHHLQPGGPTHDHRLGFCFFN